MVLWISTEKIAEALTSSSVKATAATFFTRSAPANPKRADTIDGRRCRTYANYFDPAAASGGNLKCLNFAIHNLSWDDVHWRRIDAIDPAMQRDRLGAALDLAERTRTRGVSY